MAGVEQSPVGLEVQRLLDEKWKTYLQEWSVNVAPIEAQAAVGREFSFQLAKAALQTLVLLNGGALIAFPAFAELVDATFKANVTLSVTSIGCFVGGLVLTVLAYILGYRSLGLDLQATYDDVERVKFALHRGLYNQRGLPDAAKAASDRELNLSVSVDDLRKKSRWWERAALVAVAASLASFAVGAGAAGRVLLSGTAQ